jgi:hypothetical protein
LQLIAIKERIMTITEQQYLALAGKVGTAFVALSQLRCVYQEISPGSKDGLDSDRVLENAIRNAWEEIYFAQGAIGRMWVKADDFGYIQGRQVQLRKPELPKAELAEVSDGGNAD